MIKIVYIVLTTHIISSPQDKVQFSGIFPFHAAFKLLIHPGDIYISCVINRNNKSECYYEGVGTVGEILSTDDVMYYAKLENYRRFENKVLLTLPDGKFVEHLGRENTSLNPTTSSRTVRLLKNEAYDFILKSGGRQIPIDCPTAADCSKLEDLLKTSIRSYFVGEAAPSMFQIEQISRRLGKAISISTLNAQEDDYYCYKPSSLAKAVDISAAKLSEELQQAYIDLTTEKKRKEELEKELAEVTAQTVKETESLKDALSHAEIRYQSLFLQQQQDEVKFLNSQESLRIAEAKLYDATTQISILESELKSISTHRDSLQAAVDSSAERVNTLELTIADLEKKLETEITLRKEAEETVLRAKSVVSEVEQRRASENKAACVQIADLKQQLQSGRTEFEAVRATLVETVSHANCKSAECEDLTKRLQAETQRRTEAETELVEQKNKDTQAKQILEEKVACQAAENLALREKIEDVESQHRVLQSELDSAIKRVDCLSRACNDLEEQLQKEADRRNEAENALSEQRKNCAQIEHRLQDKVETQLSDNIALRVQIEDAEVRHRTLQLEVDNALAQAANLTKECANLGQELKVEAHLRSEIEAALSMQKESYSATKQMLQKQSADNEVLREQIEAIKAQKNALEVALGEAMDRNEELSQECNNIVQQSTKDTAPVTRWKQAAAIIIAFIIGAAVTFMITQGNVSSDEALSQSTNAITTTVPEVITTEHSDTNESEKTSEITHEADNAAINTESHVMLTEDNLNLPLEIKYGFINHKDFSQYWVDGIYRCGTDFDEGEYYILPLFGSGAGYDVSNSPVDFGKWSYRLLRKIIVEKGQYVNLETGGIMVSASEVDTGDWKKYGVFLVGKDLPAGEYKIERLHEEYYTDIGHWAGNIGEYQIVSDSPYGTPIESNRFFGNQMYIALEEGQYLILTNIRLSSGEF